MFNPGDLVEVTTGRQKGRRGVVLPCQYNDPHLCERIVYVALEPVAEGMRIVFRPYQLRHVNSPRRAA